MEDLLKKDIIKEMNPYLFQKIQMRIEEKESKSLPNWFSYSLRYSLYVLGGLILLNAYTIFTNPTQEADQQDIAYEKFLEDNYFDILVEGYNNKTIIE